MLTDEQWIRVGDGIKAGRYNLLLGAGVSRDSCNALTGVAYPTGTGLAAEFAAAIPGMRPDASLSRLRKAMKPEQVKPLITDRFTPSTPGATVQALTGFRWKRVFTLNVDDALETAYETRALPVQAIKPFNHDALFESEHNLGVLPVIHLHGWAREPEKDYVFGLAEYARNMARNNVWGHILSDLIRSEPFIIMGTLLDEPDLAFFLAQREEIQPRADIPPSILVEPGADPATDVDCENYGLELYNGPALDFLNDIARRFPVRPSVADAVEDNLGDISRLAVEPVRIAEFNADFERVPLDMGVDRDGGPNFAYGHQATWADIRNGRDVERAETNDIQRSIVTAGKGRLLVVAGGPGAGKSTTLRRIAWSVAQAGVPCLWARSVGRIRVASAVAVLERMEGLRYVFVDNLADNINEIASIREQLKDKDVVVVGAERDYRLGHVERVLGRGIITPSPLGLIGGGMANSLVEAYRNLGLAAPPEVDRIRLPLANELVAIACCRILNDYEPLASIVDKSFKHRPADVDCYVFAALAAFCYRKGIELDVIAGRFPDYKVDVQIEGDGPLPLKLETVFDVELVTPANEAVATSVVVRFAHQEPARMLSLFVDLAAAIAPRVNLRTMATGEPSARIASRLFDYDEVVKPLLGRDVSGDFYEATKKAWAWNSRYWHQRAQHRMDLAEAENDPVRRREHADIAVQHARFAGTIEPRHQFTKTTLGRMLFGRMEVLGAANVADLAEAIVALGDAIAIERDRRRSTVHPFMTLFNGVSRALEIGGVLSPEQRQIIRSQIDKSIENFPRDIELRDNARKLRQIL